MKILYAIPVMFMLSGCIYQDVPKFIIDESEKVCDEHRGIWEISSNFAGGYYVSCGDGFNDRVIVSK